MTQSKNPVIKDSFTMPPDDYALIEDLKEACLRQGIVMTKGEVLRAGLHVLNTLTPDQLMVVAASVEKIKAGRPKANAG